jgi:hypothetical protein
MAEKCADLRGFRPHLGALTVAGAARFWLAEPRVKILTRAGFAARDGQG